MSNFVHMAASAIWIPVLLYSFVTGGIIHIVSKKTWIFNFKF